MKKLIVLTIIFVLLSVTFVPALAKDSSVTGKQLFSLVGYIREIDTNDKTITVDLYRGNRFVEPLITTDTKTGWVILEVIATTRLQLPGGIPITFSYFDTDKDGTIESWEIDKLPPVSANGIYANTDSDTYIEWTANRITVGATLTNP